MSSSQTLRQPQHTHTRIYLSFFLFSVRVEPEFWGTEVFRFLTAVCMKSAMRSNSIASKQQEPYVRARDNPFFDGMRRGEPATTNNGNMFDFQVKGMNHNLYRSTSDIGVRRSRNASVTAAEEANCVENSPMEFVCQPIGHLTSGRLSKTSSPQRVLQTDLNINLLDLNEPSKVSSQNEANEEHYFENFLTRMGVQKSYSVSKRHKDFSGVSLPLSAALFYTGLSPLMEIVESCEIVHNLNMFLKARRDDVKAGIPGKFLCAVIGPNVADVGSVASTITYAFYLDQTRKSNQFCTVPVINVKRDDLDSHADLHWLLDSCQIDISSLIFIDEIDLSYYDLFGSLKLVLVNCDKIPPNQEALGEAIIEVFNCRKSDNSYYELDSNTVHQDASCCTTIAEKFAMSSPGILAGRGFSRLLLAGILMDTGNLSSPHCTSKDKYMATLLLNGAGRFGCDGLYQILKCKTYCLSGLKVRDIMQKEFKKWVRSGKPVTASSRLLEPNTGMSSIGMSIAQLLSYDSTPVQEILSFQKLEKLSLLVIVSGYYDSQKKFKREILVSAESTELLKNVLVFLSSDAAQLPLKVVHQPGVKDEMKVFEIVKVTSRRTIEWLLEEFSSDAVSSS